MVEILKDNEALPIILLIGGAVIILTLIDGLTKVARTRAFEQSRREIAAYVAEGSISPQDAAALLAVSRRPARKEDEEPSRKLAKAVWWSEVNKKEASKLVEARAGADEATWKEMVDLCIAGMPVHDAIKLAKSKKATA